LAPKINTKHTCPETNDKTANQEALKQLTPDGSLEEIIAFERK